MNDDNHRIMAELVRAINAGKSVVLGTIIKDRGSVPRRTGAKMLIYQDGRTSGTVGGGEMESRALEEASHIFESGQSHILTYAFVDPSKGDPGICGGEIELFMELHLPPATLYIIGCGHVGRALAAQGQLAGYRVVVTDDREAMATPEQIPHADSYLPGSIEDALKAQPITDNTYIALVTRNVMIDRQVLPKLLKTPAPYIGVMGSRRRWAETKKLLLADGLDAAELDRFHSPLGLELNAETPEEIAVSIVAEIIMVRRGGTGIRMAE